MIKGRFDVTNIANTSKKLKNIDTNLEDVTKYYLMPSLQHVSMSNIIIALWSQADIKYQIVKLYDGYDSFLKMEDKVLDKLSQLAVPNRSRKNLSNIIHPIGKEIFDWIKYQDKYIFNNSYFGCQNPKHTAINYIDDLVWTPRGVIDYKETAKSLLAKEELFDTHKYSIACAYCLEDNIAIIASKFIDDKLVLNFEIQAMVSFWTAHLTGDFTKLNKAVNHYNQENYTDFSINECVFILSVESANPVAIKYIWHKLSKEEKSKQIVSAIKITRNTDIRCFLLSQISKKQEKKLFKSAFAKRILLHFLDDWLWGQYFLHTIHHVCNIMRSIDYLYILEEIVDIMKEKHEDIEKYNQYKVIFLELWQCAPRHLQESVFDILHGARIFFKLFNKENIDMVQLILADIKEVQKRNILFSDNSYEKCCIYLTSNQWDLLEMLIEITLSSKEDVESFKQKFIEEKGQNIVEHFIKNQDWDKVKLFLQWAFKSEGDIREFKSKLAYSKIFNDILKTIADNKAEFMELEYFFDWYVSGNAEKTETFQLYFDKVIFKLIEKNKYELLDQTLNWHFSNNQNQINEFKQYFYQGDQRYQIEDLIVYLLAQDDQLESLKKFTYYWCSTDKEINQFKTYILGATKNAVGVCVKLFSKKVKSNVFHEFMNWCYISSQ